MKNKMTEKQMAMRVAHELDDDSYVNLGIGLPMLVANYILPGSQILFQSENGIIGVGPYAEPGKEDKDLGNAGDEDVSIVLGASFMDSSVVFSMIRGGHLDVTVLGGFQVSEKGDLSNWKLPERKLGSFGGGMDLAVGSRKVIIMMKHTTKDGIPRIVKECTYPITAKRCVSMIVTDIAVIDVKDEGLFLREIAFGWTADEVQSNTDAHLIINGVTIWN